MKFSPRKKNTKNQKKVAFTEFNEKILLGMGEKKFFLEFLKTHRKIYLRTIRTVRTLQFAYTVRVGAGTHNTHVRPLAFTPGAFLLSQLGWSFVDNVSLTGVTKKSLRSLGKYSEVDGKLLT